MRTALARSETAWSIAWRTSWLGTSTVSRTRLSPSCSTSVRTRGLKQTDPAWQRRSPRKGSQGSGARREEPAVAVLLALGRGEDLGAGGACLLAELRRRR